MQALQQKILGNLVFRVQWSESALSYKAFAYNSIYLREQDS